MSAVFFPPHVYLSFIAILSLFCRLFARLRGCVKKSKRNMGDLVQIIDTVFINPVMYAQERTKKDKNKNRKLPFPFECY